MSSEYSALGPIAEQSDESFKRVVYYKLTVLEGEDPNDVAKWADVQSSTVKFGAEKVAESLGENPDKVCSWRDYDGDDESDEESEEVTQDDLNKDDRLYVNVSSEVFETADEDGSVEMTKDVNGSFNEEKVYEGRTAELRNGGNGDSIWGLITEVEFDDDEVRFEVSAA